MTLKYEFINVKLVSKVAEEENLMDGGLVLRNLLVLFKIKLVDVSDKVVYQYLRSRNIPNLTRFRYFKHLLYQENAECRISLK
jgi:hypothetical protein